MATLPEVDGMLGIGCVLNCGGRIREFGSVAFLKDNAVLLRQQIARRLLIGTLIDPALLDIEWLATSNQIVNTP
jgi:hypothetical protein